MHSMSDGELIHTYEFYKKVVEEQTTFCKGYGYFGKFNQNDYSRLKSENELLKLEIEVMKRNLI